MMSPQVICSTFLKCHVLQWCGIPSVLSPRWEVIVGCPCHDGDQTPRSHSHNGLKDNKHSLLLWPPDLLSWYQARSTTGLGPCWFSYGSQLCWSQSHSPHNHPKVNFSKFFDQPKFCASQRLKETSVAVKPDMLATTMWKDHLIGSNLNPDVGVTFEEVCRNDWRLLRVGEDGNQVETWVYVNRVSKGNRIYIYTLYTKDTVITNIAWLGYVQPSKSVAQTFVTKVVIPKGGAPRRVSAQGSLMGGEQHIVQNDYKCGKKYCWKKSCTTWNV